MNRYSDRLLHYIHRLTNIPSADAEDLLQEIFLKTYQNLNDFDQELKFSSWIYRIAHNQIISNFRKNKNKAQALTQEDTELFFERLASDFDLQEKIDQKLLKEKITGILQQLDPKYREVIILKFLEEKDYTEISDILRKPMGTVATLLNRAKSKLKDLLIKHHITAAT